MKGWARILVCVKVGKNLLDIRWPYKSCIDQDGERKNKTYRK